MERKAESIVVVDKLPHCDICEAKGHEGVSAHYDGKTFLGPWANMCAKHFKSYGVGLGLGRGQELVLEEEEK